MNRTLIVALLLGTTLVTGCSAGDARRYVAAYQDALVDHRGVTDIDPGAIDAFLAVFTDLTAENLPSLVSSAYAEDLYFSDTLHVLNSRDELAAYLEKTGDKVDTVTVDVLSVNQDGEDVYVRWRMQTKFSVMGRDIDALSVGISHLRFNDKGQVILHQDFWDSTEGLFSHLPFVGGVVRWARSKT